MKEYTIQLAVNAPSPEAAKQVANEAQALLDQYGGDLFLKAVAFMKQNPGMVQMALSQLR